MAILEALGAPPNCGDFGQKSGDFGRKIGDFGQRIGDFYNEKLSLGFDEK